MPKRTKRTKDTGHLKTNSHHFKYKKSSKSSLKEAYQRESLTLADEARRTEHHRRSHLSTKGLRKDGVSFVSAGIPVGQTAYLHQESCNEASSKLETRDHLRGGQATPDAESDRSEEILLFPGKINRNQEQQNEIRTLSEHVMQIDIAPNVGTEQERKASIRTLGRISPSLKSGPSQFDSSVAKCPRFYSNVHPLENDALADYIENMEPEFRSELQRLGSNRIHQPLHKNQENAEGAFRNHSRGLDAVSIPFRPRENDRQVRKRGNSKGVNVRDVDKAVPSHNQSDSEEQAANDFLTALGDDEGPESGSDSGDVGMTDREIAKRLAKQEELGLGSAELLLFDGLENAEAAKDTGNDDEDAIEDDIDFLHEQARRYVNLRGSQAGSGSKFTAITDSDTWDLYGKEYADFDIMDMDRASLQSQKKKNSRPQLNLSDSELEAKLLLSWDHDRSRKKARKEERESLRARGLLSKGGKIDMESKYPNGMQWDQIKEELRAFLASDQEVLSFVPLDKNNRRIVHEIANRFNVKSLSRGSGIHRHPCLTKTSRTRPFSEDVFAALESRFTRRFQPRAAKLNGMSATSKHREYGVPISSVRYFDGEIVGATAPELGAENRGRAMLEKMGWSNGTALGALNNKGLLTPLTHTVKNTRSGLG